MGVGEGAARAGYITGWEYRACTQYWRAANGCSMECSAAGVISATKEEVRENRYSGSQLSREEL